MTIIISDQAVNIALNTWFGGIPAWRNDATERLRTEMRAALTAAAPHLAAVRVNSDQIEAARKAVEELANTQMNLPLEDWSRISSAILSALEPSAAPVQVFGNSEQLNFATDMGNPITDKTVKMVLAEAIAQVWYQTRDCDVEEIDRIIAHLNRNGLLIVGIQRFKMMADAIQSAAAYLALSQPNSAEKLIADLDAALKTEVGNPATEPSAARELALEEHLQAIEQQLAVNLGYFHDEKRFLLETLQAHITTRIAAIRVLSSPDHADDLAVDRFSVAMKEKLAKKREEGRGGWENKDECSAEYLSYLLIQHIWKGDPVDIANLAMMLQQRGERVVIDSETSSIIPDHADAGKVEGDGLPQDVINLVIAARDAFDAISGCGIGSEIEADLGKALEAFASRVPYENEPDVPPSAPASEGAE